jgi:hypothetical protein
MNFWRRQTADRSAALPTSLSAQIESDNNGYLAEFALTAEAQTLVIRAFSGSATCGCQTNSNALRPSAAFLNSAPPISI